MVDAEFDMNEALRRRFPGNKERQSLGSVNLDEFISDVLPRKHQRKMARIIWDVCEASDEYFSADEVFNRLKIHVKAGLYAGYGDLERWAYSEIGPIMSETT